MFIVKQEHIDKAREAGACKEQLEKAQALVGQESTNAEWACWYAREVIKDNKES